MPIIPTKSEGFNALLTSAPVLLERLATLTERLTQLLAKKTRADCRHPCQHQSLTADLAQAAPQFERTMAELQVTLREASEALDEFEKVTASTDQLLNHEGAQLAQQLRVTLKQAGDASQELGGLVNEARPATRQLTESTLPAAEATLRDLRATSKALRDVTEKIDEQGAGALLSSQPLPDYEP